MSAVEVVMAGTRQAAGALRRHVTITNRGGRVLTLAVVDPKADHGGLAPKWTQVERVYDKPLLVNSGDALRTMSLRVDLLPLSQGPGTLPEFARRVDEVPAILASWARWGPCTVAYGTLEAGRWEITSITVHTRKRTADGVLHDVLHAEAELEFTESSGPLPRPSIVKGASGAPVAPPAPAPPAPGPRRYTVKAGDTLSGISLAMYGTAARWPDIAKANGVTDPRKLRVGQVLTIP